MNFAKRLGISASLLLVCATALRAQIVFTSPTNATGYAGVAFRYQIVASGASSFDCAPLSLNGLILSDNINGWITGTPLAVGTNTVTLHALNASVILASTNLTIVILPPTPSPLIISPPSTNILAGEAFTYTILATNVFVAAYDASPLPSWLSVNRTTGVLSGTPVSAGSHTLTLTASNATSLAGQANLKITVLSASAGNATNEIFTEGFEASFPSGWQVGDANASGTPAYWAAVSSPFGGVTAADGDRMAYCAGVGYAGGSATPKYQNNMAAFMQRTFDLSGSSAALLKFQSRIQGIEAGLDTCRVRISTDSGAKWTDVWSASRVDGDWTPEPVELNTYAGKSSVTIRFEFDSDGSGTSTGWFLDNIRLSTGQGDAFDNATVISTGTNHAGTVSAKDAADTCRVTLRKGYRYVITATPGSLADPQMWLFDPTRAQLARNDDDPQGGLGSRITYNCPATGEYYVQVGGVSGGTGSYTLLVTEQPAVADIAALSVGLTLPAGDPRGRNPASLSFSVLNNGPMDLDNGEVYSYLIEVFLSASGVHAGTGVQIGSETIEFSLPPDESADVIDSSLASYVIPGDLPGGAYYVWLHVTPLGGSPTDSISVNNWVAGNPVTIPPATNVTISGTVTKSGGLSGMPGVTVTLLANDGTSTNAADTDSYGAYSVVVSNGWSGTITPASGVVGAFTPAVRTCMQVSSNLTAQNFAWAPALTISGRITSNKTTTGVAGIAVELSDGSDATVTDEDGNYSLTVSNGWSGTVTPTNATGGFSPASRSYSKLKKSQGARDYSWIPPPKVSGSVTEKKTKAGKPGVTITFSGGAGSVVTDGSGNFSMTLPYNWTGSAAASYTGVTFSPASIKLSKLVKDKAKLKFTWTAPATALASPAPAAAAAVAGMASPAPAAVAGQLLRTTGTVRWTGADAELARQAQELLRVTLVNGEVRVEPKVPVVAPGELALALEFVPGLAGIVGTADCELAVIRNVAGMAVTEPSLKNARVVDAVLFRTPGNEAILTWDLLFLETCRQK